MRAAFFIPGRRASSQDCREAPSIRNEDQQRRIRGGIVSARRIHVGDYTSAPPSPLGSRTSRQETPVWLRKRSLSRNKRERFGIRLRTTRRLRSADTHRPHLDAQTTELGAGTGIRRERYRYYEITLPRGLWRFADSPIVCLGEAWDRQSSRNGVYQDLSAERGKFPRTRLNWPIFAYF